MVLSTFLENIVILCFERHLFKQNSVIRLKSNILAPVNFFALLRHCVGTPFPPHNTPDLG